MTEAGGFGIEVNFLTGRYVATCHNDRRKPEWPPHPARLFSALVATWADADEPSSAERAVLEWLEDLGPPDIAADATAAPRRVVSHFVPVNDMAVVSRKWQERRASRTADLARQLQREKASAGDETTRKIKQLEQRLAKQRDVRDQVSVVGNTNPDVAKEMFPESRSEKRERFFPSVTLTDFEDGAESRVTYVWQRGLAADMGSTLDGMLARLTRLGHSSSLVSCRVVTELPEALFVPSSTGATRLRSVRAGQLADLERRYQYHQGMSPRSLPFADAGYRVSGEPAPPASCSPNTAGEWIVFEFAPGSRVSPLTRAVDVATTLRATVFRYAEEPIPEGLSGHAAAGAPTVEPHIAFLGLPFAGHQHADGRLLGAAVSVPNCADEASRRALYRAIGAWERLGGDSGRSWYPLRLTFGRGGAISMRRLLGPTALRSLSPTDWTGPSRRWVSVTPIALPKHPGRLRRAPSVAVSKAWRAAEAFVRQATSHAGLPEPAEVQVGLAPFVVGPRPATSFPPFRQPGRHGPVRRQLVHAVVTFDRSVQGPLMLGAGRFVGLGLMRPLRDDSNE